MYQVFYHIIPPKTNCPDGFAAAWVASLRLKRDAKRCLKNAENYEKSAKVDLPNRHIFLELAKLLRQQSERLNNPQIKGVFYGGPLPEIVPGAQVIIVDFSFPIQVLREWEKIATIILIDHHQTAIDNLKGFSNAILNKKECGATGAWKFFFEDEPMPVFLNHIRDRDLWLKTPDSNWWGFSLEETAYFHEAMAKKKRTFELFDKLAPMNLDELRDFLLPIGKVSLDKKIQDAERIVSERAKLINFYEYGNVVTIHLENPSEDRIHSDVGACALHLFPDALFAAIYSSNGKCSLRSLQHGNNFDVAKVAERFGGGGHRNAAGFSPKTDIVSFPVGVNPLDILKKAI